MGNYVTELLKARSGGICELCGEGEAVVAFAVSPKNNDRIEHEVAICQACEQGIREGSAERWQCLAGSIWNPEPAVQALSYRLLYQHRDKEWASEIMNSTELDEAVLVWAMDAFQTEAKHLDANGAELNNGDTVVLTQVLNVKGANFMAPKGTIVRKIRLVPDDNTQIEGKINEQTIVILTKYVRKS